MKFNKLALAAAVGFGGEMDNVTLGLNWFPTAGLRFSANYIKMLEMEGGPQDDVEADIMQLRGQWAF